jgi:chemotaxis family two-component system response regulator Rcp1
MTASILDDSLYRTREPRLIPTVVHIVLIEDSDSDVLLLRHALDQHIGKDKYQLHVLRSGAQGMRYVEHARNGSTEPWPDLFVVDINLPMYSGLEILQRLRAQPSLKSTPVAILTTSDSKFERDLAERLGVSCFLRKPRDLQDYVAIGAALKRCIGERV